jgi:hypothetical protein
MKRVMKISVRDGIQKQVFNDSDQVAVNRVRIYLDVSLVDTLSAAHDIIVI